MKKLFLLILFFTSLSFAQLIKPGGKTAIISDSLSLKYFYSDSSNTYSNYHPNFQGTKTQTNIALGAYSLSNTPPFNSINMVDNIAIGQLALNRDLDRSTLVDNIMIGRYSGEYIGSGTFTNNQNIGIGVLSDYSLRDGNSNNINIGSYNGFGQNGNTYNVNIGYRTNNYAQNGSYNNLIGYSLGQFTGSNNIILGNFSNTNNIQMGLNINNSIIIGNNPYLGTSLNDILVISDANYFPNTDFIRGDFSTANLYLKGNFNVDSTGKTLQYHSTVGSTNRTAGIDSLLNGVDTVHTTAYDANSLVFITDLSAAGTPGHQYIDKINSVPGSYFIVLSKSALDTSLFNWFILKTY